MPENCRSCGAAARK